MMVLRYWALTRRGTRPENQDACLVPDQELVQENIITHGDFKLAENGAVIAIADGVGGGPDGRLAATTALGVLSESSVKQNSIHNIQDLLRSADMAVQELKSSKGRPATTIAGISLSNQLTHIFNLGDTRIYDLSGGGQILTEDHRSTAQRSAITRFLGGGPAQATPRLSTIATEAKALLICSDGLYDFVSLSTLATLACRQPDSELPRIFDMAEALGSNDNLSAILCKIE